MLVQWLCAARGRQKKIIIIKKRDQQTRELEDQEETRGRIKRVKKACLHSPDRAFQTDQTTYPSRSHSHALLCLAFTSLPRLSVCLSDSHSLIVFFVSLQKAWHWPIDLSVWQIISAVCFLPAVNMHMQQPLSFPLSRHYLTITSQPLLLPIPVLPQSARLVYQKLHSLCERQLRITTHDTFLSPSSFMFSLTCSSGCVMLSFVMITSIVANKAVFGHGTELAIAPRSPATAEPAAAVDFADAG